jgi:hypothetical protein
LTCFSFWFFFQSLFACWQRLTSIRSRRVAALVNAHQWPNGWLHARLSVARDHAKSGKVGFGFDAVSARTRALIEKSPRQRMQSASLVVGAYSVSRADTFCAYGFQSASDVFFWFGGRTATELAKSPRPRTQRTLLYLLVQQWPPTNSSFD